MIKNLKKLRQEAGISQQKLAEVILVSQQSVNKYENKDVEPDVDTLIKIADIFGVSLDYLVGRTEVKEMAGENTEDHVKLDEVKLLNGYRRLNDKQKKCVVQVIESYE